MHYKVVLKVGETTSIELDPNVQPNAKVTLVVMLHRPSHQEAKASTSAGPKLPISASNASLCHRLALVEGAPASTC